MERKENRATLFAAVPSDRTKFNIHKFKYRKLYLNIRKNFFRGVKYCNGFPREVVEFGYPSLDMLKPQLDMVLGKLL